MKQVLTPQAEISDALDSVFGFDALRPLQAEVINAILERRDTFVLMPTGGGKSLCYQLPALLLPGVTVVVSPLIALMKDQVDKLTASGVEATFINSSLEPFEARRRQDEVLAGDVKLLYVAPERLMMPSFLTLLDRANVALFAIDEAHCISEWGHDFRPEYRELSDLRDRFPSVPIAAFTATATARVQEDIRAQLALRDPLSVRGSLDRPNIHYQVWPKKETYRSLLGYLRSKPGASGIVYVGTRATADATAERLTRDGVRALAYHAGMDPDQRRARQDAFLGGGTSVMVATIAFGMGIDKPDIRFVVHLDLPKNLEGYYQESGRAGRDGLPADAVLFYSYGDAMKHQHFIQEKPKAEQQIARLQLGKMVAWAKGAACRRETLLGYFDETLVARPDPCCDACAAPVAEDADYTTQAQMFLSSARRTGERFGAAYLNKILVGSRDKRVLANGHDALPTFGIGKGRSRDEWTHVSDQLTERGYVTPDPERGNGLWVTPLGEAVLFQGESVLLPTWREARAPMAFPDVRSMSGPHGSATARTFSDSARESVAMLLQGMTLGEIAVARGFSPVTIEGHIAQGVEAGEIDLARVVSADKRAAIEAAFARTEGDALKPVKELLGDGYSYAEIKYLRAAAT